MAQINAVLSQRLQKKGNTTKMAKMASETSSGNLNTFAGMFPHVSLTESEKDTLEAILSTYAINQETLNEDLNKLITISSEVKAINAQAAILHGERIHKAHSILTNYKDGAFSSWLMTTYGNRQTPYNFLQYYLFYEKMPKTLRPQIELMPRQAIYTLASREGPLTKKQKIIETYQGESKAEVLAIIREEFPLQDDDKRATNLVDSVISHLKKAYKTLSLKKSRISKSQREQIFTLLSDINEIIER